MLSDSCASPRLLDPQEAKQIPLRFLTGSDDSTLPVHKVCPAYRAVPVDIQPTFETSGSRVSRVTQCVTGTVVTVAAACRCRFDIYEGL